MTLTLPVPSSVSTAAQPKMRRFRLRPRDVAILREVQEYRCLQRPQILALMGHHGELENTRAKANTNLDRRLRLLCRAGYLRIPETARRTWALTGPNNIYVLTRSGAKLLEAHFPDDPTIQGISEKNFDKDLSWMFLAHELEVARCLIVPRLAARRFNIPFEYTPYDDRATMEITVPVAGKKSESVLPDGYFTLTFPGKSGEPQLVHHYLEVDKSGSVNTKKMRARYRRYFLWWKSVRDAEGAPYRFTRILTITTTPTRMAFLRKIAAEASREREGGTGKSWGGLWFTTMDAFTLSDPISIFRPIFLPPEGEERVSLVEPFIDLSFSS